MGNEQKPANGTTPETEPAPSAQKPLQKKAAIQTVALIGLGAIGSYFADRLQDVLGDGLRLIADGSRARRLASEGRIINGRQRFFHIVSPDEETGPADLVLITTKMDGLRQALADVRRQVGPETLILTPLNGVESEEIAASVYGWEHILYSLMRVSSVKSGSRVSYNPAVSYMEFGEKRNDPAAPTDRVRRLAALFDRCGIRALVRPDMELAIWEKFVCNVSENQVAALLRVPFGAWGASPDANLLRVLVAREVIAVARAKGVNIAPDYPEKDLEFLKSLPPDNMPSTLQDLLAGRKTEKEIFGGTMVRLGRALGVPTPLNEFLYHAIAVLEGQNDGTVPRVQG